MRPTHFCFCTRFPQCSASFTYFCCAAYRWTAPKCQPKCQHGGVCIADGQCQCAPGYKGALCQNRKQLINVINYKTANFL